MTSRRRLRSVLAIFCAAVSSLASRVASAEEGGTGHYLPGSMADFMDGVPQTETFLVRYNLLSYQGSVSAEQPLPIAGIAALDADADIIGHGLTMLWRPPLDLGERWSYAMSATVPFLSVDVSANVRVPVPGPGNNTVSVRRSDHEGGVGDILLIPLMLNYNVSPDLNVNFRFGAYAPTGSYEVGRLANTGKNFWTFEPTLAVLYFGQTNGRELSVFAGADFNQENPDTDYKSGTQFHVEATAAQHFPLAGGLAGMGATGFWYEQLGPDTGDGATLGDFKARSVGFGPVASYVHKVYGHDLLAELKWLHEVDTKRRLEGDTIFLKVIFKFW